MRRWLLMISLLLPLTAYAVEYGPVRSGDSLWMIAKDHRPGNGVTINQAMVAVFRKNPAAFGGNINWLYVNSTLELPTHAEAVALGVAEADAEVARQNAAWKNAIDRFVSADGTRRRQLNTILSGQETDDPEVEALREELRALVTGLKQENLRLREELAASKAHEPEVAQLCEGERSWCFGASVSFASVADFVVVDDWSNLSSLGLSIDDKNVPIVGFQAVRRLGGPRDGIPWSLRTGIEYVALSADGRFG